MTPHQHLINRRKTEISLRRKATAEIAHQKYSPRTNRDNQKKMPQAQVDHQLYES
jgi:hypothetical protein